MTLASPPRKFVATVGAPFVDESLRGYLGRALSVTAVRNLATMLKLADATKPNAVSIATTLTDPGEIERIATLIGCTPQDIVSRTYRTGEFAHSGSESIDFFGTADPLPLPRMPSTGGCRREPSRSRSITARCGSSGRLGLRSADQREAARHLPGVQAQARLAARRRTDPLRQVRASICATSRSRSRPSRTRRPTASSSAWSIRIPPRRTPPAGCCRKDGADSPTGTCSKPLSHWRAA